jgi:hypothetical protein
MNRKKIGEAIYINPIAMKHGNVLTQSWRANPLFSVCRAL